MQTNVKLIETNVHYAIENYEGEASQFNGVYGIQTCDNDFEALLALTRISREHMENLRYLLREG